MSEIASEPMNETATATLAAPPVPTLEQYILEHGPELRAESHRTGENYCTIGRARYLAKYPNIGGAEVERMRKLQEKALLAQAAAEEAELKVRELSALWDHLLETRAELQRKIRNLDHRLEIVGNFNFDQYFEGLAEAIANDNFPIGYNPDWDWAMGYVVEKRAKFLPPIRAKLAAELVDIESQIEDFRIKNAAK